MNKKYYITTPLYYVNDQPHIGHAYTTIAADCLARYKRQQGCDVFFMTGTDEHGQKVETAAKDAGVSTREFVDGVVGHFRDLWKEYEITYDYFIRTTDEEHVEAVVHFFKDIYDKGYIYEGQYEGWYCTPCETFWTETQIVDGNCPDCGRPVKCLAEDTYFFRLSAFKDKLLEFIEENPRCIMPETRKNEVLGFIRQDLRDLSITRTSFDWGVPAPFGEGHVIYVWFDALLNYITGAGYPKNKDGFAAKWPADVQFIGKDILKFHCVIWPAMLMAAGITPPKTVFAHGWWTSEGSKMSKSKGNFIRPRALTEEYGLDAFRYFILREVPFGLDGDFSTKNFITRVNGELANDMGNLLNRSLAMLKKYRNSVIPTPSEECADDWDKKLIDLAAATYPAVQKEMDVFQFNLALEKIWALVRLSNKYIEEEAPFSLARDPEKSAKLDTVMYNLLEVIRIISVLVTPFVPGIAAKMWEQLGFDTDIKEEIFDKSLVWGGLKPGHVTRPGTPVFPRIETDKPE